MLRSTIFQYTKNLKDITNKDGKAYIIQPQIPEPKATQRKEMRQKVQEIKKLNATVDDPNCHTKAEIKKGSLYINGRLEKKHIHPPTVSEMFNIDKSTQAKLDKIKPIDSTTIYEKSSEFTAFAIRSNTSAEVKLAYKKIKQISPEADHVMMAYTFKQHSGYHDNSEHGAGKRLQELLATRNMHNISIFVARVYGGIPLGPKCFMLIEHVAREALNAVE